MEVKPTWSSYIPLLIKIMRHSKGDVLELGTGFISTPLLHWMCLDAKRNLVSCESDKEYVLMNRPYKSAGHSIVHVKDWDLLDIEGPWGVAFVDHDKGRRSKEIKRLSNKAMFVVVHDTQPEASKIYRLEGAFNHYNYRFDYTKHLPHTTVLSNYNTLAFLRSVSCDRCPFVEDTGIEKWNKQKTGRYTVRVCAIVRIVVSKHFYNKSAPDDCPYGFKI